ncbi:MAG: hypothetical protein KA004_04670 [Verrucomicrobiales bacterium]|nr:hypothetical protein [Verrucomicrobiales bacterium]
MKIACFIFTHAPEAPLLSRCLTAARSGSGTHEVEFIIVEDGNAPLPQTTRDQLAAGDTVVIRSSSPRLGDLRGELWFAEQVTIMSDRAADAEVIIKLDPDTLLLSLTALIRPLLENSEVTAAGFGRPDSHLYGACCAYRRWFIDAMAAKYGQPSPAHAVALREAYAIGNGSPPGDPVREDVLLSREAFACGRVDFGLKYTRWLHDKDPRDLARVKSNFHAVLFGNPPPVAHSGAVGREVIARVMDAFLAADRNAPPMDEDDRPVFIIGLGPGRSGTAFMATLLNMQPGAAISHENYSPVILGLPNVAGFAERLIASRPQRWFVGDFSAINTWMARGMTEWLAANGYTVKIVATTRDEDELTASWLDQMDRQQHDPFVTVPPEGQPHRGWSKALPKFDDIPDREQRVRAYFQWCEGHVSELEALFPGMVRRIDTADMNNPAEIGDLMDWIGIPQAGRRLELLGTPVNPSPDA